MIYVIVLPPQSNSYQSMTDPYLSSYYAPSIGFPYTLTEAPIPYLTPYGPLSNGDHHFMPDTMFGQPGGLGNSIYPHRFNFFPKNPTFSTWGTSGSQGQQVAITGFHSDTINKAPGMNSLEQDMVGLKIGGDITGQGSGDKAVGSVIGGPPAVASSTVRWKLKLEQQHGQVDWGQQGVIKPGMSSPGGALPPPPIKHYMDIGTWDNEGPVNKVAQAPMQQNPMQPPPQSLVQEQIQPMALQHQHHQPPQPYQNHTQTPPPQTCWVAPSNRNFGYGQIGAGMDGGSMIAVVARVTVPPSNHPVLEKLRAAHSYNPREFEWNLKSGRVFIIKSYSVDDIHRSIKYSIWCSTEHGNKRLDGALRGLNFKGPVYLLFRVNGSDHFYGVAEMRSPVDYGTSAGVWAQDKWKGKFDVDWLFVKDVPNSQLRHIRLENNDNKPVTNSRDTQEVPLEKAKQVLKIIKGYKHTISIFDDFSLYEKRQEEEVGVNNSRRHLFLA
uniref:YTH domain-containing family protein n=1 Tax=Oncorhynchus tshawytscha TaxID=74940 RepID=A0A8C8LQI8_ONCTS